MNKLFKGLDPVVNGNTKILILGSFPGEISRQRRQYFANKGNDFWKVWEKVISEPLVSEDWDLRKNLLLKHKIGLWDVYASAEQIGSSDKDLKNKILNDVNTFIKRNPKIQLFLITGNEAYNGFSNLNLKLAYYKIQSTPGANRRWYSTEDKVKEIKEILKRHNIQLE